MRARCAISHSLAIAAASCVLTCAAAARAQEPAAREAPTQFVRALEWRGVHALREADLAARLFTQARVWWKLWGDLPPFDEPTLEGDMQRIAATYREFGHYSARATYSLAWDEAGREVRIAIDVEEGPLVRLESFSVDLAELPDGAPRWQPVLVDPLPLHKGDPFTVKVYGAAKLALLQKLADYGFPEATLSGGGEVDVATHQATTAGPCTPARAF